MKFTKLAVLVLACLLVSALPAAADTIVMGPGPCGTPSLDCGPFTFTFNVTDSTAQVTIQNGGDNSWNLNMFSMHLWDGTITATGNPASPQNGFAFTITNGANGNNGQGTCNSQGP